MTAETKKQKQKKHPCILGVFMLSVW